MKEILATVAELTLAAKAPQYQTVLDLDRKVREKILPPHLNSFVDAGQCSPSEYMRRCMLAHYRASSMSLITLNPMRFPDRPFLSFDVHS
jgi:hypothetical protein